MRKPRTHVLIDSDLFQRVQEKCASQGLTEASATDIAVYALEQWLQQRDMNPALNSDKGLPCEEVSSSFPSPQDSPFVNPFEFAESHPCPYRTLLKDSREVLCAETKRIPLDACATRQKRYQHFEKSCVPIGMKKKTPFQPRSNSQAETRPYRGDSPFQERAPRPQGYPICPKGHNRSWCVAHPCELRSQCNRQNSRPFKKPKEEGNENGNNSNNNRV
jgi:hypothetical protein